jgi:hypothetical protein
MRPDEEIVFDPDKEITVYDPRIMEFVTDKAAKLNPILWVTSLFLSDRTGKLQNWTEGLDQIYWERIAKLADAYEDYINDLSDKYNNWANGGVNADSDNLHSDRTTGPEKAGETGKSS